jgi:hypothetical protein
MPASKIAPEDIHAIVVCLAQKVIVLRRKSQSTLTMKQ